jgi:hypothetical protein
VNCTDDPGVAAGTFAVWAIVSPGITTFAVAVHAGSALPAGQLLPAAAVAAVMAMTWPPAGYGLATMTDPVIVTVPPTGTFPVHTAPVAPTDNVPELAVSFPASLICAAVFAVVKVTLIPKYGACPVLAIVVVAFSVPPGVTVAGLNVELIDSCDTVTVLAHRGSALPAAQLLPAADDVTVLDKILFPESGVLTVTENVTVADAPAASVPVHVRFGLANETFPDVAVAFPL